MTQRNWGQMDARAIGHTYGSILQDAVDTIQRLETNLATAQAEIERLADLHKLAALSAEMRGSTLRDVLSLQNSTLIVGSRRLILFDNVYLVYERQLKIPEIKTILETRSESDAMAAMTAEPAKEVR